MGYYIQTPKPLDKASQLRDLYDARIVLHLKDFNSIPADKALICVVQNGFFDAAGLCYNEEEFKEFSHPDGRPRTWMLMDKKLAYELSGYKSKVSV